MRKEDLYQQWLKQQQTSPPPADFTEQVMIAVRQRDTTLRSSIWLKLSNIPLVQTGLAAIAAIICLLRFLFICSAALG